MESISKITAVAALAICFFLGSCCKRTYTASTQDSVRVDTRVEYIERLRDTIIYVSTPRESEKIVTRDTVSRLENSVAFSDAIVSGGLLFHSLVNKNIRLPAAVQIKEVEVIRDSIVYHDRAQTTIREVNRPTWRQKLWGTWGKIAAGLWFLFLGYRYIRGFF